MHRWVSFSTAVTLLLAGSLALAQTAGMEHRDTRGTSGLAAEQPSRRARRATRRPARSAAR